VDHTNASLVSIVESVADVASLTELHLLDRRFVAQNGGSNCP